MTEPKARSGLYYARESRKLTQPKLADLAGTTKQTVGRLEDGTMELTRAWAERFAEHLKYSAEQIEYWDLLFDTKGKPLTQDRAIQARLVRHLSRLDQKMAARVRSHPSIQDFAAGAEVPFTEEIERALTTLIGRSAVSSILESRVPEQKTTGGIAPILVIGVAEAGAFRAMPEFGPDEENGAPRISAPRSSRYPKARHFALEVRGDSMNACRPPIIEGMHVLCVDIIDAELTIETGQIYVVRQTRDGGQTYEWTVKRAHVFRDRIELRPESTNPNHQPVTLPRDYDPHDETEVRACGWVYGTYSSLE